MCYLILNCFLGFKTDLISDASLFPPYRNCVKEEFALSQYSQAEFLLISVAIFLAFPRERFHILPDAMEMVQKESGQRNDVRRTGSTPAFRNRSRYHLSRSGALCPWKAASTLQATLSDGSTCGRERFTRDEPRSAPHDDGAAGSSFPPGRPFSLTAVTGPGRRSPARRGPLQTRPAFGGAGAASRGRCPHAPQAGRVPAAWSRRRGPEEAAGPVRPGLSRAEGKFLPPGQRQEKPGP